MVFREKARRLFNRSRGDSLTKSPTKDSSNSSSGNNSDQRWPSNVYRPGEPMPRPKYRAVPKKDHKDKLEAFNFADAWRKKSFQSTYSPMGTRMPSRRNSWYSVGRKSIGGKSFAAKSEGGRTDSVASADTDRSIKHPRVQGIKKSQAKGARLAKKLTPEPEHEGDDDVGNVGLSRAQSRDQNHRPPTTVPTAQPHDHEHDPYTEAGAPDDETPRAGQPQPDGLQPTQTHGTAYDHHPFTADDLNLAMQRSRLEVPAGA